MTDQELTAIYKRANGIGEGKNPPISTKFIFAAMRESAKEALTQAATIIRADKWPTPRSAYHEQYNQQIEALANRVEQIGEVGINGLTNEETDNTMSVRGLSDKKPTAYERKCFNDWKNP